jgi:hypothetical protein
MLLPYALSMILTQTRRTPASRRKHEAVGRQVSRQTYPTQVIPLAVHGNNSPIVFLVADIEDLIVGKAVLASCGQVGLDVVELAKEAAELNVAFVVEGGAAEDEDCPLVWLGG